MSDQDNGHVSTLQHPTTDDPDAWKAYWKAQGWPWRTEPEIDAERQKYLAERRTIKPDIGKSIYPFKDVKLSRADVEWLLATHENGRGPVDWSDKSQRDREGLDLRGADLRQIDLTGLPLANISAGLTPITMEELTDTIRDAAATHLEGALLKKTHLEGADLWGTHLERAILWNAHLERAILYGAHLEGAILAMAHLEGAILNEAFFDNTTIMNGIILSNKEFGAVCIADTHWNDVNVAVVNWSSVKRLGDEYLARLTNEDDRTTKNMKTLLGNSTSVRANRQLSVVLQSQGLNEDASRFAYRAQNLQRAVFRRQKKFGQYLFSGFLDLLAGYGYHPLRTLFWYVITICTFAVAYHYVWTTYHLEKITHHPLTYVGAFVFSITAFHGRGFFLGGDFGYDSLITILAAIEAVIGLIIEFSFIATFTQRFFGR